MDRVTMMDGFAHQCATSSTAWRPGIARRFIEEHSIRESGVCVPPPLGGAGCSSNGVLFRTVNRNVQSTDTLSIILETLESGTGETEWKDVLRADSFKVFVPISDDDSDLGAESFDNILLSGFKHFGTRGARRYVFYPIVGADAFPSTSECGDNAENNGQQYLHLADMTHGRWYPICATDFGPVFQDIGKGITATVACEIPVPEPSGGGTLDHDKVNVTVTFSDGKKYDVLRDASKACDAGANGWQYSEDRTRVLLCGAACESVRADDGAKVSIQLGCATRMR